MAERYKKQLRRASHRGERAHADDLRGFDALVSDQIRPEFDEAEATEDYRRDYGPYDYGWGSERPGAGWMHPRIHWRLPDGPFIGRGPKGYRRSDTRIREDVCDRLADAPFIDASDIEVTVKDGEVTLSGTVASREQKRRSEDVIESVTGVRDINNRLRISTTKRHDARA